MHCGKTKASAYTENILGPKSVELVQNDLDSDGHKQYFFLSTDASNRGNAKMFPIILSYFIPTVGMKNKIIEFYSDVFQKLKSANSSIIKSNCNCRVIHNAAKTACKKLSFDLETLVNTIYSEFSSSTSNKQELRECFTDGQKCANQMVEPCESN